jgi:hypothetical protein
MTSDAEPNALSDRNIKEHLVDTRALEVRKRST